MSAPATAVPGSMQRSEESTQSSQQDIANLAYALWQERGSLDSSAEQDWIEAERQLQNASSQNGSGQTLNAKQR